MIKRLLSFWLFVVSVCNLTAQTSIQGQVRDENGEPIISCQVKAFKNGVQAAITITDYNGNYRIELDPGKYDIEVSYLGKQSRIRGITVLSGKSNIVNIDFDTGQQLDEVVVKEYKAPLIEQDNTTQGGVVTAEKIRNLPTRNVQTVAATTAGISNIDGGNNVYVRGSRSDQTVYILDGIRITGRDIPTSEIEQLQIVTGGIEAQFGDVAGGIISLTSKGPSNQFSGGVEWETSSFLDPYNWNLISANISGPIIKKNGRSILGFRATGQYIGQLDDDPPAYGDYFAKESVINSLIENPITRFKGAPTAAGYFLTDDQVNFNKYNLNEQNHAIDLLGKIDYRPTQNIELTLFGNYSRVTNRFTPTNSALFNNGQTNGAWTLLNWPNNPIDRDRTWRVNFRIRHRLGRALPTSGEENAYGSDAKKVTAFQNASYVIQFGYQNETSKLHDYRHEDRFGDYGYVGQFNVEYDTVFDLLTGRHAGYLGITRGFTPGNVNPAFVNYNKLPLEQTTVLDAYRAINGRLSPTFDNIWSGIHANVGSVFNRYELSDDDLITGQITFNFDFAPGKGRHSIQLGILGEQRFDRSYVIAPFRMWEYGRLYANDHIVGVDTNIIIGQSPDGRDIYQTIIAPPADAKFYRELRKITMPDVKIEEAVYRYANVDQLTNKQLKPSMFSPTELNDQGMVGYFGYDYLGNKLPNSTKFEDFFKKDTNGVNSFLVPAYAPIYGALFVQDKFTYKDIIFRLGLRGDYFDANTKVLKDRYSLYDILGARAFHEKVGTKKPNTIGDDFKVYLTNPGSTAVKAYRKGDQWYFPNGTQANNPNLIFGQSNLVFPAYSQPVDSLQNIRGKFFKIEDSFEDYLPQFNLMPRLAFSFPISDEANFFAHYDILVQRPTSNNYVSPLQYYYFNQIGRTPANNGSLRPAKTIDYEVGFQQKLTNSSAIKMSAYYKEIRDMIQRTTLSKVAVVGTYDTYGNLDFGTVKGFNFTYDLRRTYNFEMTAGYTLQFADGTGSDPESQRNLTQQGITIRNIFPFSYDERHRFAFVLDYRYGAGKGYNGPVIYGKRLLENTGLNIQLTTASGRPYSPGTLITRFDGSGFKGAINGARYPWNFTVDLRLDRNIPLTKRTALRQAALNVYLRVQNLLDTRNIIGVYRGSGDPRDDGYLKAPRGIVEIKNTIDTYGEEALDFFIDSYNWRLINPDNFTLPRRVILGAILDF